MDKLVAMLGINREAVVTVSDDPRSVISLYNWTENPVGQGEIKYQKLDRPNWLPTSFFR